MTPSLRPPLRHRATVTRNVETGVSPTRSPLPPRFEVVDTALPCHFWEPGAPGDGEHLGPNTDVVSIGPRMLVRRVADVGVGDEVSEVRAGTAVIRSGRLRVTEDLWRSTHRELGLELVSGVEPAAQAYS